MYKRQAAPPPEAPAPAPELEAPAPPPFAAPAPAPPREAPAPAPRRVVVDLGAAGPLSAAERDALDALLARYEAA